MTRGRQIQQVALSSQSLRQLHKLDDEIAKHKKGIRQRRNKLQEVARQRSRLLEKLKQFGIEYIEQGAEDVSHGQQDS